MKQYAVEVMTKYSNGRYGKVKYTTWCLAETSKAKACSFACEILASMTWREILSERYDNPTQIFIPTFSGAKLEDTIGYDNASKYFSFRAELMKEDNA